MIVRTVAFVGSVADQGSVPPGPLPQIAFSGRSNVGKSSLINVILQRTRKKLAHVSGSPGKTQTLNFYQVNEDFFLVDLPGYGYAKVPKTLRASWETLISTYLRETPTLAGVVHLVDARHPPTNIDKTTIERLAGIGLPVLIVLTKMDKLSSNGRTAAIERAARDLGVDEDQLLPFSAKTKEGREVLLESIDDLLSSVAEGVVSPEESRPMTTNGGPVPDEIARPGGGE